MGRSVSRDLCSIGMAHWNKSFTDGKNVAQLGFSAGSVEHPYSNFVGSSTLTKKPMRELKSFFFKKFEKR